MAAAVFEVSAFFRVLPREVEAESFGWLLEQLDRIARYKWRETVTGISASEAAFGRVLARAFGQEVPELPDYEAKPTQTTHKGALPEWQQLFEAANKRPQT